MLTYAVYTNHHRIICHLQMGYILNSLCSLSRRDSFLQRDPTFRQRGSSRDCRATQEKMVLQVTRDDDVEALAAQEEFTVEDGERDVILSVRTNGEPDE